MLKYRKITKFEIEEVMECFCLDLDAAKTAIHTRLNRSTINRIEAIWSFAKRRIAKFYGIRKDFFLTYLKECEWRYSKPFQVLSTHLRTFMKKI